MIETTDFLWPVCSPANLPEGEGINAVNWRRRELCSPGCCGAVITDLLFCLPPWPSWGFPNPRVHSVPTFPPFSPSFPTLPLLSTDLSLVLGPSETPFQMTWHEKQSCNQPAFDTRPWGFIPACGFSSLKGAFAPAGPWAATVASWWDWAPLFSSPLPSE